MKNYRIELVRSWFRMSVLSPLTPSGVTNVHLWQNFNDASSEYLKTIFLFSFSVEGKGIESTALMAGINLFYNTVHMILENMFDCVALSTTI